MRQVERAGSNGRAQNNGGADSAPTLNPEESAKQEAPSEGVAQQTAEPTQQLAARPNVLQAVSGRIFTAPAAAYNNLRRAAATNQNRMEASADVPTDDGGSQRQNPAQLVQNMDRTLFERRLEDVFYALENTPWHVVYPSDGGRRSYTVVSSPVHPLPHAFDVPTNAQAVIVISSLRHQRVCQEFVVQLQESQAVIPPIIVMVMAEDGIGSFEEVLELQRAFRIFGVRDTMVQRSVGKDLRVDMAMCVRRALDTINQVHAEFQARMVDIDNRKFWPIVHKVFQGLPKYDASCSVPPLPGARIGNHELLHQIGFGAFSDVYMSRNRRTNEFEAVKVIPKTKLSDTLNVAKLWNEMTLLNGIRHPNVMAVKGVKHALRHLYIIMEYSGERNLFRFLKALPETSPAVARVCMQQISKGVAYIHQAGVAHRDLKPENIVVMDRDEEAGGLNLKIVDFGCATKAWSMCKGLTGTVPFIAPEITLADSYWPAMADMWSCGIVMLELMCGIGCVARMLRWSSPPPMHMATALQIVMFFSDARNLQCSLEAFIGFLSEEILDLVFGLLEATPSQRCTASEAANCAWLLSATEGEAIGS